MNLVYIARFLISSLLELLIKKSENLFMKISNTTKKIFMVLLTIFLLCGCSNSESNDGIENPVTPSRSIDEILWPSADRINVNSDDLVLVDYSNVNQGYIMAKTLYADHSKLKIQIINNDETYTYDIDKDDDYITYPLNMGDGNYTFKILENSSDSNYLLRFSFDVSVKLDNEYISFLYPNQIVDYDIDTLCITKSFELVKDDTTDLDRVESIYTWVLDNISYDWDKVEEVQGKYVIPILDEVYTDKKGICFDYAAIMAAMLRVQHIPTKVVTGMVDEGYHAWIEVYIENMGWIKPHIYFDSAEWTTMDPTYDATNKNYEGTYTNKYTY